MFSIVIVYGEISHFLSDPTEVSFLTNIKNVDTYHKQFQLEIKSNKKGYRQKSFDKLILNEQYFIVVMRDHAMVAQSLSARKAFIIILFCVIRRNEDCKIHLN